MRSKTSDSGFSDETIKRLRDSVFLRRIEEATEWLQPRRQQVLSLKPTDHNAAKTVGYLSQLVDSGCIHHDIVKELVARFSGASLGTLPLSDYIHLKLAEGVAGSTAENTEDAINHFDFVISLREDVILDDGLLALAHFWKGRCKRKQGKYTAALDCVKKAQELAVALGLHALLAVIQVLEGFLYFDQERLDEASAILRQAESVLRETDDVMMLGNIHSGYGRIALCAGRYDQALTHLASAMDWFAKRAPAHRNIARSLVTGAHARRLISLYAARKIDAEAVERRGVGQADPSGVKSAIVSRRRLDELRTEALSNLAQAEEISRPRSEGRLLGLARLTRGFLCLDIGDLEHAGIEATAAYDLIPKADRLSIARVRILQSMVESAKYEEGIDERQNATPRILRAQNYAKEALACARETEDRRLTARAYMCYGLTMCAEPFADPESARECYEEASKYFNSAHRDYLWPDYQAFKAKVLNRGGSVDVRFQKWSRGLTDGESFHQMVQEFADIIIPKVWEREGRKISRVATTLSISPKKVRRVLGRLGLKSG
ncbi:MAG TPA: tetratricopeptide repeat protein [Bryobacteraceae bacterium]|nr:tetratricopeptide repeat protein [Bryobacteraceae bacterium]